MLGCDWRRERLKRRWMARPWRHSSSRSASSSIVAETLRFLAEASVIVASICRLIVFRFSWCSFCSRGVIAFLSGLENEGVVFQQGDRFGREFIKQWIAQRGRWL